MKVKAIIFFLIISVAILYVNEKSVPMVNAADDQPSFFMEGVNVSVNCTTAKLYINCMVTSNDTSLVHFPPEIDMSRTELTNAVSVSLIFSRAISVLIYAFNNTDIGTARALADAVKASIEAGFDTSFTFNSTGTYDSYVNVTYIGSGKTDLTSYMDWLMDKCLISDLGGFSLTFIPMTSELNASILVSAVKESGSFDWMYSVGIGYSTNMQVGSGDHKIDFLDLLNVNSISPSPYALTQGFYTSVVMLAVVSNETVSYVSSEPGLISPPDQLKGWYIQSTDYSPVKLLAYFSFGDDPTPVDRLSLTFSGLIIPELAGLAPILLTLMMLIASFTIIVKRKIYNK